MKSFCPARSAKGRPAMAEKNQDNGLDKVIRGFLQTLPGLEPVIREITKHEELVMKLELSEPKLNAVIDLSRKPLKIDLDSDAFGHIGMAGSGQTFHEFLLGRQSMATAINHRKLVVRGPTSKLMKITPMFFVVPYIYPFYLQSIGRSDLIGEGRIATLHLALPLEGNMNKIVSAMSYAAGYALGIIKTKLTPDLNIIAALESLGKGLDQAAGNRK